MRQPGTPSGHLTELEKGCHVPGNVREEPEHLVDPGQRTGVGGAAQVVQGVAGRTKNAGGGRGNQRRGSGEQALPAFVDEGVTRTGTGESLADEFQGGFVGRAGDGKYRGGLDVGHGVDDRSDTRGEKIGEGGTVEVRVLATGLREQRVATVAVRAQESGKGLAVLGWFAQEGEVAVTAF